MVVIGFATGTGTYRAWGSNGPERFQLAPPISGSVEAALLVSAPELCVLDLRTARNDGPGQWFNAPRAHRLIGGGEATNQFVNERRVASDYDVLVWLANTSATSSFDGANR
jgi:erythromycin esterase-like protein